MTKWTQWLLMIGLICAGTAQAWWSTPHMLVAEIAYLNLDPDVRERANALIAINQDQYDFVSAAVWADDIKMNGQTDYNTWHYVRLPFHDLNEPMPTRDDFPKKRHVSWAIMHERMLLGSPSVSDQQKGIALRRLIHWVGDIHQPLHAIQHVATTYPSGDSGGHRFLLAEKSPLPNLHQLWDSGVGQWVKGTSSPLSEKNKQALQVEAQTLLKQAPKQLGSMDPYDWALESHALARAYVYRGIGYQAMPTDAYLAQGVALSRAQVTLAGLRLAAVLNEVLKEDAPSMHWGDCCGMQLEHFLQ